MRQRVCLAGATGYLGTRLSAQLRAGGFPLTAIVRSGGRGAPLNHLLELGADLAFVDAARHEPYAAAMTGVGTAISCMASRNVATDAHSDFWAIDRDANIRFGRAAIDAGARQLMLVATFEGQASRTCTAFSDAKEQAVDALTMACAAAGVAFIVIRPTAYFSDLTDRAFLAVASAHRYVEIGDGATRINPVDGDDVAAFMVARAAEPGTASRQYPLGGPDTFTFREIGELAAEVLQCRRDFRVAAIPLALLEAGARLAAAGGVVSRPLRRWAALLRWMIYAGTHDAVAPNCGRRTLRDHYRAKVTTLQF